MAELQNGRIEEWKNGGMAEWQNGGMAESSTEQEADAPRDADGGKTAPDQNRQKCARQSDRPAPLQSAAVCLRIKNKYSSLRGTDAVVIRAPSFFGVVLKLCVYKECERVAMIYFHSSPLKCVV